MTSVSLVVVDESIGVFKSSSLGLALKCGYFVLRPGYERAELS